MPRTSTSFNPLHCGAVVASGSGLAEVRADLRVSIPFIAGQWSLPSATVRCASAISRFQSPSLRGSGRFRCAARFLRSRRSAFQSPSLRGSGRFR